MSTDENGAAVEVVVLLASAGGLAALSVVLKDLPVDFPAAVVVQQHLGGHTSVLPAILSLRTHHDVSWAVDGQPLRRRHVSVCPAGVYLELERDGTCSLRKIQALRERRFDVLLTSVAASYGPRALAVVLSGSGHDGVAGTIAMKRAGGFVIAQSRDTAEYPSLPVAVAEAGADCVLSLHDIGRVLVDIEAAGPVGPGAIAAMLGKLTVATMPDQAPIDDVTDDATGRGEAARRRAAELEQRRNDLAAGHPATPQTVATARSRADEALRRAERAHRAQRWAAEHRPNNR